MATPAPALPGDPLTTATPLSTAPIATSNHGPRVVHTMSLGDWLLKKARATILDNIAYHVLFLTAWAAMITCVNQLTEADLTVSNQLLTVLGTVLGFVVSWRSSSAYDKYKEGVKLWSQVMLGARNLGSQIWFHVKPEDETEVGLTKAAIEKRTMLNLVIGFATALKHYLRGEPGIYYDDLHPYVSFLPRSSFPSDPLAVDPTNPHHHHTMPLFQHDAQHRRDASRSTSVSRTSTAKGLDLIGGPGPSVSRGRLPLLRNQSSGWGREEEEGIGMEEVKGSEGTGSGSGTPGGVSGRGRASMGLMEDEGPPLVPGYNPPRSTIYNYFPPLVLIRPFMKTFFGSKEEKWRPGSKRRLQLGESNVPLEILLYLSSYIAHVSHKKRMEPPLLSVIMGSLGILQDALANLERVLTSPVPVAYQFHLRFTVWTYLLLLPFQVFKAFGWITIPATTVASIIYLGFVEIGTEIENPFGFDANDLDLDWFAVVIRKELAEIAAHPPPDPAAFVFTHENRPFWPAEERCARDLVEAAKSAGQDSAGGQGGGGRAFSLQDARRTANRQFKGLSEVVGLKKE